MKAEEHMTRTVTDTLSVSLIMSNAEAHQLADFIREHLGDGLIDSVADGAAIELTRQAERNKSMMSSRAWRGRK